MKRKMKLFLMMFMCSVMLVSVGQAKRVLAAITWDYNEIAGAITLEESKFPHPDELGGGAVKRDLAYLQDRVRLAIQSRIAGSAGLEWVDKTAITAEWYCWDSNLGWLKAGDLNSTQTFPGTYRQYYLKIGITGKYHTWNSQSGTRSGFVAEDVDLVTDLTLNGAGFPVNGSGVEAGEYWPGQDKYLKTAYFYFPYGTTYNKMDGFSISLNESAFPKAKAGESMDRNLTALQKQENILKNAGLYINPEYYHNTYAWVGVKNGVETYTAITGKATGKTFTEDTTYYLEIGNLELDNSSQFAPSIGKASFTLNGKAADEMSKASRSLKVRFLWYDATKPSEPVKDNTDKKPDAPAVETPQIKAGDTVTDPASKAQYTVTNAATFTVEYKAMANKNAKTATVPDTITINKKAYKVTGIAKNAFKNSKKLKKITIGANITKIGSKAFYGCKNLKSIKIKTVKLTNKTIGKKAFSGIHAYATIKVPKKMAKKYAPILKKKGIGKGVKVK